jgi:hypothetical protein
MACRTYCKRGVCVRAEGSGRVEEEVSPYFASGCELPRRLWRVLGRLSFRFYSGGKIPQHLGVFTVEKS